MLLKQTSLGFVLALSSLASAQSALTNESIQKLAAAGLPDETVVRLINTQPGSYSTSPAELAELRQAGVSAPVLAALVVHQEIRQGNEAALPAPTQVSAGAVLRDGTPVRLRLTRTLSSGQDTTGEKIDFEVLDDIRVDGKVVIARGSRAIGAITNAEPKRRMGRAGKLDMALEYVRLPDGTKAALRAARASSGGGHVGAMTAGIVATSLVVWPAAPLFLMMHGKDAVIPEGTEVTAYVNGDAQVQPATTVAANY